MKNALGGHGQPCVLRQPRHPVLMFVQILLKQGKMLFYFKGKITLYKLGCEAGKQTLVPVLGLPPSDCCGTLSEPEPLSDWLLLPSAEG